MQMRDVALKIPLLFTRWWFTLIIIFYCASIVVQAQDGDNDDDHDVVVLSHPAQRDERQYHQHIANGIDNADNDAIDDDDDDNHNKWGHTDFVIVRDYLEDLSDQDLQKICLDRGFDLIPRTDGQGLQHEDYIEAARRCIAIERELQSLLEDHPELVMELEAEIERMKLEKERLEQDRNTILAEKAMLEQRLKDVGVELPANIASLPSHDKQSATVSEPIPEHASAMESIRKAIHGIRLLAAQFLPVLRDVRRHGDAAVRLFWRITKPTINGFYGNGRRIIQLILSWLSKTKQMAAKDVHDEEQKQQ